MGGGGGKSSKSAQEDETQVVLNVYDLTPLNHYTYWFGFGIFHSGIEVHGMEYGFGAHDFPVSGVFEVEPKTCPGFIYRNSITLGSINIPPSEFRQLLESIADEYHGDSYHLITKNCNHFTEDIASRLIGKGIPKWINRLARAGAACSCLLPDSLQMTTISPATEYHECLEDEETVHSAKDHLEYAEDDEVDESKLPQETIHSAEDHLEDAEDDEGKLPTVSTPKNANIKEAEREL